MQKPRYAILIDGGFLTRKLHERLGRQATADDIIAECDRLATIAAVIDHELLRVYYYDAYPASEAILQPVSGEQHLLGETERFRQAHRMFDQLVLKPNVALRMGQVNVSRNRWRLKPTVTKQLIRAPRPLTDDDFVIDAQQKGVDMRIGMDIARLSLREMVRAIIVVTGDSDFVPAFKFARREGVRVILEPMGQNVLVELKQHADIVLG